MFGLCNQTVIRWFTVQNQSDSCSFVAVVTTARVVLSNSFSDRVILQWVSELWPKTLKEEFVHLSVCFGTVYQWLWVFQTCICVMALVTCCITWQSSLLFLYTLFINESRFLGLRAEWVKPCHTPCAENTSRFLPKNTVSHFLLGRIPLSNLVNFCPVISSTKGDIIVAQLLSSNFAMKEYPQNFNLVTLKSKYMISIQGLRRHLINCYYYFHLIFIFTVDGQRYWLLRLQQWFPFFTGIYAEPLKRLFGRQTSGHISLFGMEVQILPWVFCTLFWVFFFGQLVIGWAEGSTLDLLRLFRWYLPSFLLFWKLLI